MTSLEVLSLTRHILEGPCTDLSARLLTAGRRDLSALLREVLPPGDVVESDTHRVELVRRLAVVAEDVSVDDEPAGEARRLARIGEDLSSAIARQGTVWIAWWVDDGPPWEPDWPTASGYGLSWQGEDDDRDLLENGPDTADFGEALTWARRRAPRVIVRPSWDFVSPLLGWRGHPSAGQARTLARPTGGGGRHGTLNPRNQDRPGSTLPIATRSGS